MNIDTPLFNLFKFPILMVDGSMEEKKNILGLTNEEPLDLIRGYAECPFQDFVSVTDRWIPTPESFEKAQNGEFDACFVVFSHSGQFIVPWTREKFKAKYSEFVETIKQEEPPIIELTMDEMKKLIRKEERKKKTPQKEDEGEV